MDRERWQLLESIFEKVVELPPSERDGFVDESAKTDPGLAAELRALLDAHATWHPLLDRASPEGLAEGTRIGPYEVSGVLGSGGGGTVYLARRADRQFEKQVAIKLLDTRLAGPLRERFGREQQILARLDHPSIARLIDAGIMPHGTPYLVMEYVDGVPVTVYATRNGLTLRDRLQLFRRICEAVQYSHQHLVIHRDIKPGNILVTAEGLPRLLDFGTAKLLEPAAAELDSTGTLVALTPKYASPEQILRAPISTATDVYSLGVLLYELLTGRLPYRGEGLALPGLYRAILEEEIVPLSRAGNGNARQLRGDLEQIAGKALRKEPGNRYRSVQQFSDDIDRYLNGFPVLAGPDSARYRLGRFVRRHRFGVAAAGLVAAALCAGMGMFAWQARIAGRERAKAQAVSDFLLEVIGNASPTRAGVLAGKPVDVRLVDLLDASVPTLGRRFAGDPGVEVRLRGEISHSYAELQQFAKAREQAALSLSLARRSFGENSREAAESWYRLGRVAINEGAYQEAEKNLRTAAGIFERLRVTEAPYPAARNSLALAVLNQGRSREALPLLLEVWKIYQRDGGTGPDSVVLANNIATVYYNLNDRPRFREWIERSVAIGRRTSEPPFPFGNALNNLAQVAFQERRFDEAIATLDEAIRFWQGRLAGHPHADLATALANSAIMKTAAARAGEAVAPARQALDMYLALFPRGNINTAHGLYALGMATCGAGSRQEGQRDLRESLEIRRQALPPGDGRIGSSAYQLGKCLLEDAHAAEAEPLLLEGYRIRKALLGENDPSVRDMLQTVQALLAATGRPSTEQDARALAQ